MRSICRQSVVRASWKWLAGRRGRLRERRSDRCSSRTGAVVSTSEEWAANDGSASDVGKVVEAVIDRAKRSTTGQPTKERASRRTGEHQEKKGLACWCRAPPAVSEIMAAMDEVRRCKMLRGAAGAGGGISSMAGTAPVPPAQNGPAASMLCLPTSPFQAYPVRRTIPCRYSRRANHAKPQLLPPEMRFLQSLLDVRHRCPLLHPKLTTLCLKTRI